MPNFDENNITHAVLQAVGQADDPRTRAISEALVRHLHAFIREVEPSFEEWLSAVEFLTEVGQTCSATRQEFILLSDTLGASMLVDAINHRLPANATETTVLGPFYVKDPPVQPLGADISGGTEGEAMVFRGSVRDWQGGPLTDAVVDTWHSDDEGCYDVQHYDEGGGVSMRARFRTDATGRFWFRSIVPSAYPIPDDGPVGRMLKAQGRHPYRPAHVHFMISAPGCETLVTHVFVAGDDYLGSDVVFGVKESLIRPVERQDGEPALMTYDFVLGPAK